MLGERIRKLREASNETQDDLKSVLGLNSRQHIGLIETGSRKPPLDVLVGIAKHYNVTTDYLLGLTQKNIDEENNKIYEKAIETYGTEAQEGVAQEKCAELIQAISKKHRGKKHNIAEEIADVEIMLEQLKIINDCFCDVENIKQEKVTRLEKRLEEEK